MTPFNRLYIKLATSLLVLFLIIGAALLWVTRNAMDQYYQEITQRLNASVAMYVTGELQLISDGEPNQEALKQLAHHAMIINPAIEVYLVATDGKVLSHALEPNQIRKPVISLDPIHTFLSRNSTLPLKGDDPRQPEKQKIFSACEVRNQDKLEGYVYIVLEGKKHQDLASRISDSHVFRLSTVAVSCCLLFGLISSLLIFARLSRRLNQLTLKADRFYQNDPSVSTSENKDEIARLDEAFDTMQQRINEQMQHIKQADEMRRELITNISHDLRTPLTSMQGYIETVLLKQNQLSPTQLKQYLQITRKHAQRLGNLIADLFELTKLDSNAIKPQLEHFSIAELIQDIIQEFGLQAEKKDIQLSLVGEMDNAYVYADIRLIERVIGNLLDNALRHTARGGSVKIELKTQPEGVRVTISDDGEGISEIDLPHIFERFFHARNSEQESLKSTGLGLAIVKRILDLHLAKITVDSSTDSGTCFSFVLSAQ